MENEPNSSDRLSIRLTENGFFDVEKMRSGVKSKLKTAFSDPELATKLSQLGITSGPSVPDSSDETKIFTEQVAPAIYGALNSILVAAPRRFGYTAESCASMAFTDAEVKNMAPLTGKVLAKHLGGRSKYQEEYLLATMVLMGIMGKCSLLEKPSAPTRLVPRVPSEGEPETAPLIS